jgi:hypothetical protein
VSAALNWAVIVLGAGNIAQVAERWHLVNRATELADRIAGMHGERVRVVAPPKAQQQGGNREAKGYQRDANGRFASSGAQDGPVDIAARRTGT